MPEMEIFRVEFGSTSPDHARLARLNLFGKDRVLLLSLTAGYAPCYWKPERPGIGWILIEKDDIDFEILGEGEAAASAFDGRGKGYLIIMQKGRRPVFHPSNAADGAPQ